MPLILNALGAIRALELAANINNATGRAAGAHLAVVGALELMVLYLLFAAARAALYRRRIHRIDGLLRRATPQFSVEQDGKINL